MGYVLASVISFVFGALDQYLGGSWTVTHIGFWAVAVSLMSAPWLALPFLFGCTQVRPSGAVRIGLAATLSALLGYFVMTLSPLEGVSWSHVDVVGFLRSQMHVIIPGLVSGPVFGWLGFRWRTTRSWVSAAWIAGAFCLEPLARRAVGQPLPVASAGAVEILAGLLMASYFATSGLKHRRRNRPATQ